MNIVGLLDSFKNSFSSQQAADVMAKTLTQHKVSAFAVADGGEGTVHALAELHGASLIESSICGPDGEMLESFYGWDALRQCAILEAAEGAGIQKVSLEKLDPRHMSSYGVGQQLRQALDNGAKQIIIGLGGTATVDVGYGMLCALGACFHDEEDRIMDPYDVRLEAVARIDLTHLDPRVLEVEIVLASDVTNPLLGEKGSVAVFGPQKGIRHDEIMKYERAVAHFAHLLALETRHQCEDEAGSGAAGGIAYALMCVAKTAFRSGFSLILEHATIRNAIAQCDLIITGEGSFDEQSFDGKLISGILDCAGYYHKPVLVLCGINRVERYQWEGTPIQDVYEISQEIKPLSQLLEEGLINLEKTLHRLNDTLAIRK